MEILLKSTTFCQPPPLLAGETVHVDFGCLFDHGLTLAVPERVPFRLTQNVIDCFGVSGVEGTFRRAAEMTLQVCAGKLHSIDSVKEGPPPAGQTSATSHHLPLQQDILKRNRPSNPHLCPWGNFCTAVLAIAATHFWTGCAEQHYK